MNKSLICVPTPFSWHFKAEMDNGCIVEGWAHSRHDHGPDFMREMDAQGIRPYFVELLAVDEKYARAKAAGTLIDCGETSPKQERSDG